MNCIRAVMVPVAVVLLQKPRWWVYLFLIRKRHMIFRKYRTVKTPSPFLLNTECYRLAFGFHPNYAYLTAMRQKLQYKIKKSKFILSW